MKTTTTTNNTTAIDKEITQTTTTSYLNNDRIDELIPIPKRTDISCLSLTDQLISEYPSTCSFKNVFNSNSNINTSIIPRSSGALTDFNSLSKMMINNNNNNITAKPQLINHKRIASYVFAFDIDGVLVRGPNTLNEGVEAIKYLEGNNPYNIKVPYIFVTNGGGKHESLRAEDLSNRLETEIVEEQIIQGHTPMKELSNEYDNVLVIGGVGDNVKKIAKSYGFKNVFTSTDIMRWNPSVTPYYELTEDDLKHCINDEVYDFSKIKIDAILVFADSRNWAADQQIILELLMSDNGYMGTISKDNFNNGPSIYFAHSDFVWSTNYNLVRYGMGALQVSIAALYKEHTGKEMKVIRFGKPQKATFEYANKVMKCWRKNVLDNHFEEMSSINNDDKDDSMTDIFSNNGSEYKYANNNTNTNTSMSESDEDDFNDNDNDNEGESHNSLTFEGLKRMKLNPIVEKVLPPPSTVYFVGDTPESDIRFANSHDESWFSILVNTGVYQKGTEPKYKPKHHCENVLEAVKFAVEREHAKECEEWNRDSMF